MTGRRIDTAGQPVRMHVPNPHTGPCGLVALSAMTGRAQSDLARLVHANRRAWWEASPETLTYRFRPFYDSGRHRPVRIMGAHEMALAASLLHIHADPDIADDGPDAGIVHDQPPLREYMREHAGDSIPFRIVFARRHVRRIIGHCIPVDCAHAQIWAGSDEESAGLRDWRVQWAIRVDPAPLPEARGQ